MKQVHGDRVLQASGRQATHALRPARWAKRTRSSPSSREHWVGVSTADCVPVLIVDPEHKRVAAVHSGWRGTDADISARAVEALVARGSRPERMLAAVGPAIQQCCYVVSPELAKHFAQRFGSDVVVARGDEFRLDLARAVVLTLRRRGREGRPTWTSYRTVRPATRRASSRTGGTQVALAVTSTSSSTASEPGPFS